MESSLLYYFMDNACFRDEFDNVVEEEDGEWIFFLSGNNSSGTKKYQRSNSSDGGNTEDEVKIIGGVIGSGGGIEIPPPKYTKTPVESPIPPPDPITSPTILTPSPVSPPLLLFDPRYFFVLEELLPPMKQIHPPSSSSTTLSNSSRKQALAYKLELPEELSSIHNTFHVSNLKKCLSDESIIILMKELQLDDKLNFVEEPVEIMDREIKQLKRSHIPIVKVRWNSKREPEFTWEREDKIRAKYPHLFSIITLKSN
ncbi:hypothetical protein Tco_0011330 [Tanacetum coccineum]